MTEVFIKKNSLFKKLRWLSEPPTVFFNFAKNCILCLLNDDNNKKFYHAVYGL